MASPDKVAAVAELTERFSNSSGAVLTEYRGLSVKALKELRRSLGDDATYAVSKNTLTTIAAREAGVERRSRSCSSARLRSRSSTATRSSVAKGLRDFARANPFLVIKGGVLDGKPLTAEDVRKLADLESREVLLAKVAGGMKGVLQQAIGLVSAPLSQAARLFAALQQAAEDESRAAGRRRRRRARVDRADLSRAPTSTEPTNEELDRQPTPSPPRSSCRTEPTRRGNRCRTHRRGTRRRGRLPQQPLQKTTKEGPPSWRSSAPTSSWTRSRS